jgi:hypothetical protein
MSNMDSKKIYAFGSCRVQAAARSVHDICAKSDNHPTVTTLNRKDVLLHSTKEILNIISPSIPESFDQYVTKNDKNILKIKDADIFLIEISSNKCRSIMHESKELFFKLYGNAVPGSKKTRIGSSQIQRDIFNISSILQKPIVFVSTFNLYDNFKNPIIKSRDNFCKLIESCAIQSGNLFFDPSIYMQKNIKIYQNVNGDEIPVEDLSTIDRKAGKIYVDSKYIDSIAYHYEDAGEKLIGEKLRCFLAENKLI